MTNSTAQILHIAQLQFIFAHKRHMMILQYHIVTFCDDVNFSQNVLGGMTLTSLRKGYIASSTNHLVNVYVQISVSLQYFENTISTTK